MGFICGMLKKSVSKAAADGSTAGVTFSPARPELLAQFCPDGYVEDAFEVRTPLADFFSILPTHI